jgi:hypothetical protein
VQLMPKKLSPVIESNKTALAAATGESEESRKPHPDSLSAKAA